MKKRYITLNDEQREELERAYRRGQRAHFRNRCRAILLSDKGYDIDSIADIFGVYRQAIYRWFNGYEKDGIKGLENKGKGGRKPKLDINNEQTVQKVKKLITEAPQSPNKVLTQLEKELEVMLSKRTLHRFLKKLVFDGNDFEEA